MATNLSIEPALLERAVQVSGGGYSAQTVTDVFLSLGDTYLLPLSMATGMLEEVVVTGSQIRGAGINEAGQITGEFTDALGIRRGFVATPYLFADGFESGDTSAWATP